MNIPKIDIVFHCDYEALYLDGKLVDQDHHIDIDHLQRNIPELNIQTYEVEDEDVLEELDRSFELGDGFPEDFTDLLLDSDRSSTG